MKGRDALVGSQDSGISVDRHEREKERVLSGGRITALKKGRAFFTVQNVSSPKEQKKVHRMEGRTEKSQQKKVEITINGGKNISAT